MRRVELGAMAKNDDRKHSPFAYLVLAVLAVAVMAMLVHLSGTVGWGTPWGFPSVGMWR